VMFFTIRTNPGAVFASTNSCWRLPLRTYGRLPAQPSPRRRQCRHSSGVMAAVQPATMVAARNHWAVRLPHGRNRGNASMPPTTTTTA
jgi:hypothetical protein